MSSTAAGAAIPTVHAPICALDNDLSSSCQALGEARCYQLHNEGFKQKCLTLPSLSSKLRKASCVLQASINNVHFMRGQHGKSR